MLIYDLCVVVVILVLELNQILEVYFDTVCILGQYLLVASAQSLLSELFFLSFFL